MTVSRLAALMFLDASTVVRILNSLEEKSLVQRIRSTYDRRVVSVSLTEKGGLIMNQTPNVAHKLLMNGLKVLSENKLHTIALGLSQLVNILDSQNLNAT
jgi:DNA-binding MarR family transcriptional regulator